MTIRPIGPGFAKAILDSHGGPARLNNYRVVLPSFFLGGDAITLDTLCRSATLPGRSITTVARRTNMKEIQVPTGYVNTPVDMIFTETTDFTVSRYLDNWMGRMVDSKSYEVAYRDDIMRDILIMSTDRSGVPQYVCVLQNAMIKTKTQINLSDAANDTPAEVNIIIEYEDFEVIESPTLGGIQDGIRMLRSGSFRLPTNLLRGLTSNIGLDQVQQRITDGIGGLL
jgi:hypothetical protein